LLKKSIKSGNHFYFLKNLAVTSSAEITGYVFSDRQVKRKKGKKLNNI